MNILFLSAEVEPFAKVGGLADVAGSLPKALDKLGHQTRVVMPAYGMVVKDPRWGAKKVLSQFPVSLNPNLSILADLYELEYEGLNVWLVDGDHYFNQVSRSEEVYSPSRDAYLFFSQAALEACKRMAWRPDIVHANDWHAAFAPVFLREKFDWDDTASVYTIHNLAYQGDFGPDTIETAGLDWMTFNMDQLETWGTVNFLKSGCVYADQVNTVSPTYAQEIQTEAYGCRLQGLMSYLSGKGRLRGILNGIDVAVHDPSTDPRLPFHFESGDLAGKASCREALCQELGLKLGTDSPLLSVVSRLSNQKGFDLILADMAPILNLGATIVILAIGDPAMGAEFRKLADANPGRISFVQAYDADLAQRVYAGSDIFLMPSSFEPCGLGQMFALRYGTIPVVRKTGGLADTVFEGKNGFVFDDRTPEALLSAIERAFTAFQDHKSWSNLVKGAMSGDFSWEKSAADYVRMYNDALASRRAKAPKKASI